ncbi:MAG: hypothetical protein IIB99_04840 [Planctomycetes bacterium]|nr:hypothetical protein [Planctomycetota bacterium]
MERGPLIEILKDMKNSDKELDIILSGSSEERSFEIRNVVEVEELKSAQGIRITTEQNYIWLDASHVSAAYQARTDLP